MSITRDLIAERLQMFDSDRATVMADYLMPLVDRLRAEAGAEALEAAADAGDTKGLDRLADHAADWLRTRAASLRVRAGL